MPSFFEATGDEGAALLSLVQDARRLAGQHHAPDGYSIGVNRGVAAGKSDQTAYFVYLQNTCGVKKELKGENGMCHRSVTSNSYEQNGRTLITL